MPHVRFARFVILDSLPAKEFQSGRHLHEVLQPYCSAYKDPIPIDRVIVPTRQALFDALEQAKVDAVRTNRVPLIHIECHGNDDGLKLANDDFVFWEPLSAALASLNATTRLNLFVSVAACFGAHLSSQFQPLKRAPVSVCLSTTKTAYPDELLGGFRTFYQKLLSTADAGQAISALKEINVATDQSFYLGEATDFFVRTYKAYLTRFCTPENYRERAQDMHEEQKERGLAVASVKELEQILVRTEKVYFERARERYFMTDLFPENSARFPVKWASVDTRNAASKAL